MKIDKQLFKAWLTSGDDPVVRRQQELNFARAGIYNITDGFDWLLEPVNGVLPNLNQIKWYLDDQDDVATLEPKHWRLEVRNRGNINWRISDEGYGVKLTAHALDRYKQYHPDTVLQQEMLQQKAQTLQALALVNSVANTSKHIRKDIFVPTKTGAWLGQVVDGELGAVYELHRRGVYKRRPKLDTLQVHPQLRAYSWIHRNEFFDWQEQAYQAVEASDWNEYVELVKHNINYNQVEIL